MGKNPIALFIDGENLPASHMAVIMQKARDLGDPIARCVVGDFLEDRLKAWVSLAPKHALELVFQPSGGKQKNSADIALTIRAMDLLAEKRFSSFLIVSSDCDFAPLALRLRRSGVAVYGMGEEKSGVAWRSACTEFFELVAKAPAKPSGSTNAKPAPSKKASPAPAKKLAPVANKSLTHEDCEAIRTILADVATEETPWIGLSQLGLIIRRQSAELGTRFCGKNKLLKNLRAAELIDEDGHGSGIKVRLRGLNGPKPTPSPPTAPRPSPSEARPPA